MVSLDDIPKHIPPRHIELARRYAINKQKGRPPKVPDDVIERYIERYKGLSKKDVWKIMR